MLENRNMKMNREPANTERATGQREIGGDRSASGEGIGVDVFDNFDEIGSMQGEWDAFMETVGAEVFLTYDWCRIWWKYYGKNRNLKVFVFRRNEELVGIVPMFFERIWVGPVFVRVAKIVGTDYTTTTVSLPIAPDSVETVMKELLERVFAAQKVDLVHFGPLSGLYPSADLIRICSKSLNSSYCVRDSCRSVQTYLRLADNWQEYLSGLSKNMRRTINRSYRDLCGNGDDDTRALLTDIAEPDNCEETFDRFAQMHQSHWQRLGKLGHFADWPCALEFHHEAARAQLERGRLRLLKVKLGNHCLGYEYDYRFGNKYHAFLNARASLDEIPGDGTGISVGSIVFSEQVKRALKEKVSHIDMMPGADEYKLRLGGQTFPIRSILIFPKKLSALIRVSLFRTFSRLVNFCYYRIWFCRIAPKLPLKRRCLWRIWIRTRAFV